MFNIVCLLVINLGINPWINPEPAHFKLEFLDTIPIGKMIPYLEDSSVLHTRQELYLRNLSELMGLSSLHGRTHEEFIRIWLWDFGEHYIIDVCRDSSKYSCSLVFWHSKSIDSSLLIVIDKQLKGLMPKSGWDRFFDTLRMYQIENMKSGLPFEKHDRHLTQSSYVQFEVAKEGGYRFYEFLEPSYYRFIESGSNNVYRFLKYFDQEMGVDVYMPPDNLYER